MTERYSITVRSRRRRQPDGDSADRTVLDLTSKGGEPWVRFSPFYPIGNIPVPGWPDLMAASVEGIWQGLKRFENEDEVDFATLRNTSMRGLKRTSRGKGRRGVPRGRVLGHQFGPEASVLLGYLDARLRIYLPSYRWVLENSLRHEVEELRVMARAGPIVLLDFETNDDVRDTSRPLSHCSLVKRFVEDAWPG